MHYLFILMFYAWFTLIFVKLLCLLERDPVPVRNNSHGVVPFASGGEVTLTFLVSHWWWFSWLSRQQIQGGGHDHGWSHVKPLEDHRWSWRLSETNLDGWGTRYRGWKTLNLFALASSSAFLWSVGNIYKTIFMDNEVFFGNYTLCCIWNKTQKTKRYQLWVVNLQTKTLAT